MRKLMVKALLGLMGVVLAAGVVLGPSPAEGAFPGANGKIAFSSDRDGNYEIYVMNADGSGQTNLTNSGASDYGPAWSADGARIAFTSTRDGNQEVYVMNADGSGVTRLTNNPGDDIQPAWSPDGTKLAFTSRRPWGGNPNEIYVMNADGSGVVTQLTFNAVDSQSPSWSPDGTRILFAGKHDGNWEFYVVSPYGTGQTRLTNSSWDDSDPAWSPDGTKILSENNRDGNFEIYVMNADGSGVTRLTNNAGRDMASAWSPDGTKIAFSSDRDGQHEIYVMNSDGSGVTRLTNNPAGDNYPDWQPLVYDFSGFFAPVDNTPALNLAKAGSAIPVKFSLNGDQGLDIFAAGYPNSLQINCDTSASVDGIEQTVTAGSSSLSYDAVADQYVYVWKTDKAWAGTCRQLIVRLNDGTDHMANFKFK